MTTNSDLATPDDIDRLVAEFYRKVLRDPIIGFFFTDLAQIDEMHLPAHLHKISAFWQQQLLGVPCYRGQTFAVHAALHRRVALTSDHFHRWLFLFEQTLDELFDGPRAQAAQQRARAIAKSMQQALAERHPTELSLQPLVGVRQQEPPR